MQQGGGSQSPYAEMAPAATTTTTTTTSMAQQPVESASPISSRPPSNLDELTRLSSGGGGGDEDIEGDRAGGVASGNRWPRQETLTLLKIRSDMDAVFRDATTKGPLWEDVSRKLAEFGYKRSAKKCKEKFENVHKYYKRTKEGRAGRQDGKSYKFFSQLEALYTTATAGNVSASSSMPVTNVTTANTITLDVAPVSIGIPFSITSSVRVPTASTIAPMSSSIFPPNLGATISPTINVPGSATAQPPVLPPVPISFSSDSSSSPETEDDDDDDDDIDFDGQPSNTAGSSRKRKRQSFSSTNRMMEFFENLMKQVMQKQESMQQRFLELIEKREQDRMIREEAWKRQEMARLAREHEIMVRERAISASRDTAIVSLLQQITGQTIQFPPDAPPPAPAPAPAPAPVVAAPTIPVAISALSHLPLSIPQEQRDQQSQRRHQQQQQQHQSQHAETLRHQPASTSLPSSEIVIAIPEQQVPPQPQEIGGSGNFEPSSSRWPKVEVLALIKLRSGLELRYQEAGPKGPLWEEISSGMQRMGYKRSAKRCKEKWENINKYFKKVKESNKKRPEDAKTCPYFHELDALYRKKIIGSSSGTSSFSSQNRPEEPLPEVQHQQESIKLDPVPPPNLQESSNVPTRTPPAQLTQPSESDKQNVANVDAQASIGLANRLFREGNGESSQKPEDIVKELMQQQQQQRAPSLMEDFDKYSESENMEEEEEDDEEDTDDEDLEERKMGYKVEFQRQNANSSNGGGSGTPSFLAVVQ